MHFKHTSNAPTNHAAPLQQHYAMMALWSFFALYIVSHMSSQLWVSLGTRQPAQEHV
jgi:hypothetical protein